MKVLFKKLNENAVMPTKAHATDAGFDLTATSKEFDEYGNTVYGTGIAVEIPKGYVGLVFPRSSNAKTLLTLSNSVGVIDSGYRGEIMFKFRPAMVIPNPIKHWWKRYVLKNMADYSTGYAVEHLREYNVGDRIGQLIIIPYPEVVFEEADKLSDSDRGKGGYGSTGR